MPELPEVETTLRAIRPVLERQAVVRLTVREPRLRWPVPAGLPGAVAGREVRSVTRRAKYLLVDFGSGTLIVHLGMSGSIRILPAMAPPGPHEHVDLELADGRVLRYKDPRRFGAWLWATGDVAAHPLLRDLGPEPWDARLTAASLHALASGRRVPVKSFIMDNAVLVGVGNIYANEALFRAGVHPLRAAGRLSLARWETLLAAVREVLAAAIAAGGTTLRDFSSGAGRPGYFVQALQVYGRTGEPCPACGALLREVRIGGRASVYCPHCQR